LKLKYDALLSNFAFNCNLSRYIKLMGLDAPVEPAESDSSDDSGDGLDECMRCFSDGGKLLDEK
jgi:hypothetical protein